jgi:hypothetical protein
VICLEFDSVGDGLALSNLKQDGVGAACQMMFVSLQAFDVPLYVAAAMHGLVRTHHERLRGSVVPESYVWAHPDGVIPAAHFEVAAWRPLMANLWKGSTRRTLRRCS